MEKNLTKLFNGNEYFSSPGIMQEKGSGLGLKICAEFVELNNGKIWVKSEPGKGTSFYFTVPKSQHFSVEEKNDMLDASYVN